MNASRLTHLFFASCGWLTLAACPGDDEPTNDTEAADDSTGSGSTSSVTTTTASTTTADDTTTATETSDPTTDPTTESSTGDAESSGTVDASSDDGSSGSTGDTSSGEGSSGSSDTGVVEVDAYGDCSNFAEADACNLGEGEVCIEGPAGIAVCAEQNCVDASDCATPSTGDAEVTCGDFTNDGVALCHLPCDGGTTCPDGMACLVGICAWGPAPEGGGLCPDEVLGADLPLVAMGTNEGTFDDVVPECGGFGGGDEAMLEFTAPVAGNYTIDTVGSDIDTVLMVLDTCGGVQLACNDDGMGLGVFSGVSVDLARGQTVILAIDGYDGEVGDYVLNIDLM